MLPDILQRPCRNIRHFLRGTHASLHDGPNSIRLVRALSKTQEQTRQVFPTRCQHGVGTICYRCLHRKASCPGESSLIKSVLAKSKTPFRPTMVPFHAPPTTVPSVPRAILRSQTLKGPGRFIFLPLVDFISVFSVFLWSGRSFWMSSLSSPRRP